jgi:hypothetical protein
MTRADGLQRQPGNPHPVPRHASAFTIPGIPANRRRRSFLRRSESAPSGNDDPSEALEGPAARPDGTGGASAFSRVICRKFPEGTYGRVSTGASADRAQGQTSDYSSVGSAGHRDSRVAPNGGVVSSRIGAERQEALACSFAMRHNRTGVCINGEPSDRGAGRPCAEP